MLRGGGEMASCVYGDVGGGCAFIGWRPVVVALVVAGEVSVVVDETNRSSGCVPRRRTRGCGGDTRPSRWDTASPTGGLVLAMHYLDYIMTWRSYIATFV